METPDSPQKAVFVDYLYAPIARAIEHWDDATARDAFALWLVLSLDEDDIRYVQIEAVGYSTNAVSAGELAESYGSKWSPYCIAHQTELNLCHPSHAQYAEIYGIQDKHDKMGCELRDAYLDVAVTRFDRSDSEKASVNQFENLQRKINDDSDALTAQQQAQWENLSRHFELTEAEIAAAKDDARWLYKWRSHVIFGAFLSACGAVIARLHQRKVVERKCGQMLPIGLAISNDFDDRAFVETVKISNPPGWAREMEEQMMGRTYAQIEAEAALMERLERQSPDEQADFWAELMRADARRIYSDAPVPAVVNEVGLFGYGAISGRAARLPEVASHIVSRLIPFIETHVSPLISNGQPPDSQAKIADSLLSDIDHIGTVAANRGAVSESDIKRLHALLSRLFEQSETVEKVGITTFTVARVLHTLRPHKFPPANCGAGGVTANRLLNYREFGLSKQHPDTPDYDEAAEAARRAQNRGRF